LVSVIYEWSSLEVLRIEMEPGSALVDREIGAFPVIHFIIEGSPVFVIANQSCDLIPGDSIALRAGESYRISNAASSRSIILTILDKTSEPGRNGAT
jgi:mannose-6-phosphate isomerase-like protein (cupin superfamily)